MNLGLVIALSAAFVWSLNNVVHKVMASRLINSPLVMMMVYNVMTLLITVTISFFVPAEFTRAEWLLLAGAGLINIGGVFLYYSVMRRYEPSRVVPLFAFGSVAIVIMSAFILGEQFGAITYVGIAAVIFGSMLISARKGFFGGMQWKPVLLMAGSGILFAGPAILAGHLVQSYSFASVFAYLGMFEAIWGLGFALLYRRRIREALQKVRLKHLLLSMGNECITISGNFFYTLALSLWYVSLVETFVSLQFVLVFIWGLVIARWWPKLYHEHVDRQTVVQKTAALSLIILGIYLVTG